MGLVSGIRWTERKEGEGRGRLLQWWKRVQMGKEGWWKMSEEWAKTKANQATNLSLRKSLRGSYHSESDFKIGPKMDGCI